ncbi:MAG: tetratricopeptide repeat protein [Treponema sp.]|nr:tetratricopeptide repeat protein [Spirochaetia bacterium]MDY2840194.1 tetratricopeptide repeat protein [Treponema sp.]MDY5123019.1 tetratricopeptide repeat protein [Treponema sp.]
MIISILIAVIVASFVVVLLILLRAGSKQRENQKKGSVSERIQKKGKSAIVKDAERHLAHDPHNVIALETLGVIYYNDKNWEKAWGIYKTLYDISSAHVEINVAKVALRMGVSAYNRNRLDDALSALMLSARKDPEVFESNFYLGKAFYDKQAYDKCILCMKKARTLSPENSEVVQYLAMSLFKMQKYKEALPFLKKVLDEQPDNKEILYDMAISMSECGMGDKALKVFMHLRPDPLFGAQSCLEAGKMHERLKNFQAAVQDYEIASKLQNVPEQILIQIKYRLANTYIALNDIPKGLVVLKQIQGMKSGYKDVDALVTRYSELNQNKNLQTYLMAGTSDFVALCRKFITVYHSDGFVKVEDVQIGSECVEVICSVESPKWSAKEMFRFYRSQNVVGDIYVRDFHAKIRDTKCDKGICVSIGNFSESSHKFIEGRPIDLVEKEQLVKLLKKINIFG